MRLVCPKCAAQYEVAVDAIPENGRDVQCASCGNTWFQERLGGETAAPSKPKIDEEARTPRPAGATADRAILDILRREAEFDAAARQGGDQPVEETAELDPAEGAENYDDFQSDGGSGYASDEETYESGSGSDYSDEEAAPQTPLADDDLAARARAGRSHAAETGTERPGRRLNLADPAADPEDLEERELMPAPRRPRQVVDLPDVDSLKSSLRAAMDDDRDGDYDEEDDVAYVRKSRKRRAGFYLALNIALLLMAAYVLGEQIKSAVPAASAAIDVYVETVDVLRRLLADGFARIVDLINGLIAGNS